jgi:serine-type D-Ala-D-Ala carboxypeptidase/endopeptidase (penicillin-binding protein 4)
VSRALAAWLARAACFVCTALACTAPALAVDRSLGANVPKPSASGAPWTAAEVAALGAGTDLALAGAATLRGAHAGFYAVDARDGRVLYARNADDLFQPASTLKLVTGSAALDRLGPAFRFTTQATIQNTVVQGVLQGYVTLRGTGDVQLDGAALATLAPALRAVSITEIEQDVIPDFDDRPAYPPGWAWDDFPWAYAAPVTALGFAGGRVTVTVKPGARAGAPVTASVAPFGAAYPSYGACNWPELRFCIIVKATTGAPGSESTLDARRLPYPAREESVEITGTLAAGADPEELELAQPNPPFVAAAAANRALSAAGMRLRRRGFITELRRGADDADRRVVWTHASEPLADLVADVWIPSDNLMAEQLLRALGAQPPALRGTSDAGIAYEKAWLARLGVDARALTIADGSGLSAYDRLSPRNLVAVLQHDWDGPYRDLVLDDLPLAGVRGTLRTSFAGTAAEKRVFAKTGSMSHVSALAGYVATAQHGTVIFAFLVDDWPGDAAALKDLRARVLAQIAGM